MVREKGDLNIPLHLRNAPTQLMNELDYGKDYAYSHDHIEELHLQEFLPDEITGEVFYKTKNNKKETDYKKLINQVWKGKYQ